MTNEINDIIKTILVTAFCIVLIIATFAFSVYMYHRLEIQNFQITIKDLSDEQKCLHICGFEFDGFLETYKFCAEKCDRISERLANNCGVTQ